MKKTNYPSRKASKGLALLFALVLVVGCAIGGTVAYLTKVTPPVVNTFIPGYVKSKVIEDFDGTTKTNIQVENEGNVKAYMRVKLVTYRVNAENERIGGKAEIPAFNLGANWVENGGYYYYTVPVEPDALTGVMNSSGIALQQSYSDADGGKQVIEVMAEAFQSEPAAAIGDAWGVSISQGSVTAYQGS